VLNSSIVNKAVVRHLKPLVFALCLLPFLVLIYRTFYGLLDADPVRDITRVTGQWGIRILLVTLAVTPLRKLTGWHSLARVRRMLGLFSFFYISLHFTTYLVLDQFFAWEFILEDIAERPYILFGFTAFVSLIPLAITSNNAMIKRLGGKRWQQLHKLVYVIAVLGLLHYYIGVKADITKPAIYGIILFALLGYRWIRFQIPQRPMTPVASKN